MWGVPGHRCTGCGGYHLLAEFSHFRLCAGFLHGLWHPGGPELWCKGQRGYAQVSVQRRGPLRGPERGVHHRHHPHCCPAAAAHPHTGRAVPGRGGYIRIIFLGIPATVLFNYTSTVLHSLGDSQHPFYFLLISSFLNIGLDWLFIVPLVWAWRAQPSPPLSASCSAACFAPGGSSPGWRASISPGKTVSSRRGTAGGWPISAFRWALSIPFLPSVPSSCRMPSTCWAAPPWPPRPPVRRFARCSPCHGKRGHGYGNLCRPEPRCPPH